MSKKKISTTVKPEMEPQDPVVEDVQVGEALPQQEETESNPVNDDAEFLAGDLDSESGKDPLTGNQEIVVTGNQDSDNATAPFTPLTRDPRLPPVGSTLTRKYKGVGLHVTVLENGFEYEGQTFSSISKVAKKISGHTAVNGFAFFRLGNTPGGKGGSRQGTGHSVKLLTKIKKIESLMQRLKIALDEGFTELHDAGTKLGDLKEKASGLTDNPAE
jgi:hypothetical protein